LSSRNRRAERTRKRLPCALFVEKRRHAGMVLDLSANGLFVQTSAAPEVGERVTLECHLPNQEQPARLETRVARRKLVPPKLRTVAQGGLGLRIENAPEPYYAFVAEILREQVGRPRAAAVEPPAAAPPAAAPPAAAARRPVSNLQRRARELALRRALGPREPQVPKHRFHVRVGLGARSRTLTLDAADEEQARSQALAQLGAGWMVLRCERED
jgi:Tfp pilus assembly protein PilZ